MVKAFDDLEVRDVMSVGVISCEAHTPLRAVAAVMAARRVHAVFVLHEDEDEELWGLVSDLDLVAAVRGGVDDRTAGESAITPLVLVAETDSLEHAADLMTDYGISHLAVVDTQRRRPVGVVSTLDIARAISGNGSRETRLVS